MERLTTLFQPSNYRLTLDINQKKRTYRGVVLITGKKTEATTEQIKLNAAELEIEQILVNQMVVNFTYDQDIIIVPVDDALNQQIEIKFSNKITDQMYGIYPCYYQFNGQQKEIIATQFESHYARYAFPCIDEPAAKANFDLTIIADADNTILSNTPILEKIEKRNRQLVRFEITPKMSPYTLGFIVGKLIKIDGLTKSGVQVSAYASQAHNPSELKYGLQIAIEALDWYEQYFGVPYPLPKCDHIALPDFAAGAMENWGLVTYRESTLLAQSNTPIELKTTIATVITHELAHMWFGNLVTMWWWDELWLNESLASILENRCLNAIRPKLQVTDNYYAMTLFTALRRDSLPGVQPIVTPINRPEEISTIFDGAIVYSKGACLMHMIESWVGEEIFQTGLQNYLKKYSYNCAGTDDFLKIFDRLSHQPIGQIMKYWLNQAGFPKIEVSQTSKNWQISQKQFGYNSSKIWAIPIQLDDSIKILDHQVGLAEPEIINDAASTYAVVDYSNDIIDEIVPEIINSSDISQYYFLSCQLLLTERGDKSYKDLVPYIKLFSDSSSQLTWLALTRILYGFKTIVQNSQSGLTNLQTLINQIITPKLNILGLPAQVDEPINDYRLRNTLIDLVIIGREPETISNLQRRFNIDCEKMDANLRPSIIAAKLLSENSDGLVKQLIDVYRTTTNHDIKDDIAAGLAICPWPSGVELIISQLRNREIIKPQDIIMWYALLIRQKTSQSAAWRWLQNNFTSLIELFQASGDYADFVRITAAGLSESKILTEFQNFFVKYQNDPVLKREIAVGIEQAKTRVNLVTRQSKELTQALKSALSNHSKSSTTKSDSEP